MQQTREHVKHHIVPHSVHNKIPSQLSPSSAPQQHRDGQCTLTPPQLLAFCQEVAAAMSFLSHKGFIHRDLAARNILLDQDTKCKARAISLTQKPCVLREWRGAVLKKQYIIFCCSAETRGRGRELLKAFGFITTFRGIVYTTSSVPLKAILYSGKCQTH